MNHFSTIGFERLRFSKDGKIAERQEVFVEVKKSSDIELTEQTAYVKLFELYPDWDKGLPVNDQGIGWSSALILPDWR